eukprot:TRINITY_DN3914_c0_g1_i1.p1 TRINITY_DN3914_c0_g1~~TRINITY_DN3914_c0_g1_i1.p1  ORF type:complete len:500 (-),score=170.06 TRINITY_DN3914_c0_g1_i1:42-1541(-)
MMVESGRDESPLLDSRYNSKKHRYTIMAMVLVCLGLVVAVIVLGVTVAKYHHDSPTPSPIVNPKPKNIIMMVSDGFGPAAATLGRTYAKRALTIDQYSVGTVRTFSANSLITDSAAGATAYACGVHANNTAIGVDKYGVPCGTVLEAAVMKGMKTGLVVTSSLTDATPASFSSHVVTRDAEEYIALQQLDQVKGGITKKIDVMMGGGLNFFSPETRSDHVDLLSIASSLGYTVVQNKTQMQQVTSGKILGLFAEDQMAYQLDRNNTPSIASVQPTMAEMTTKALQLLDQNNPNGFFLLLEGSLIDVAEHNNDAASAAMEVVGYDEMFAVALEFAKKDGNTIIISTSDHETGGLTLGLQSNFTPGSYPNYAYYPEMLYACTASADTMARLVMAGQNITNVLAQYAGITDLTEQEIASIDMMVQLFDVSGAIGKVIATRCEIGFTTHGHTGVDVNLYTYGLPTDTSLQHNIENINIATFMANWLSVNLTHVTSLLSVSPRP